MKIKRRNPAMVPAVTPTHLFRIKEQAGGLRLFGDRNLEIEGAPTEQAAIAEHGHWSPIEHGRPCPISERHDDKSAVDLKSDQPFHLKPVIRPFHPEQRAVKIHDKPVCPSSSSSPSQAQTSSSQGFSLCAATTGTQATSSGKTMTRQSCIRNPRTNG
jgi:hypothetical protein